MMEGFGRRRGPGHAERYFGGWRGVASAWAVALVFLLLFAGVQALASRHSVSPRQQSLVGAVIPRHDPSCAIPSASGPASCPGSDAALDRAAADAYSDW